MSEAAYVELRCRSAFSFLDGASLPEDLELIVLKCLEKQPERRNSPASRPGANWPSRLPVAGSI